METEMFWNLLIAKIEDQQRKSVLDIRLLTKAKQMRDAYRTSGNPSPTPCVLEEPTPERLWAI